MNEDVNEDFQELLIEGVHDKAIFKAVFLAGGPGSGKDYVLSNTLDGHGLTEINSDKALEFLMDKEGLDKTMPEAEKEKRDVVRGKAKNMTELRQRLALMGRNGLIINGTGDDHEKIGRIKDRLEEIGYDTSMIMVNTNDEVSAQRNVERGQRGGRTVPEDIRRQKWEAVQNARPELAKMFGTILQRPSSVSAVKIDGERAHARVRAGEKFELPAREILISQLDVIEIRREEDRICVDIEVTCSAGTFIRAIARDCGDALGVGGHLSALRRTRVASFTLENAVSINNLKSGEFSVLSIASVAMKTFPFRSVAEDEAIELSFGRALSESPSNEVTAAISHGELLALLKNEDDRARPIAVFAAKN